MMLPVEITVCLVAIAGSVRLAATEFNRLRKHRQMTQALCRAVAAL